MQHVFNEMQADKEANRLWEA